MHQITIIDKFSGETIRVETFEQKEEAMRCALLAHDYDITVKYENLAA